MFKYLILLLTLTLSTSLYARGGQPPVVDNDNRAKATADSVAGAAAGAQATNQININDGNSRSDFDAEPAIAPSISGGVSDGTCLASRGGSGAAGGVFALGFLGVVEDKQCQCRENAELRKYIGVNRDVVEDKFEACLLKIEEDKQPPKNTGHRFDGRL